MTRARSFASISNGSVFAILLLILLFTFSFDCAQAKTYAHRHGTNTGEIPTAGMPAFSLPQPVAT